MTERELRRLSRADLLEMLIDQSVELQQVKSELAAARAELEKREIDIREAGSIAEAALRLNGVFEAAQAASEQYLQQVRLLSQEQEGICAQLEQESREKADRRLRETERSCAALEQDTKVRCAEMLSRAEAESKLYWDEVSTRLEAFYREHASLKELLQEHGPK